MTNRKRLSLLIAPMLLLVVCTATAALAAISFSDVPPGHRFSKEIQ